MCRVNYHAPRMSCLLHQDHENPVKTWFYRIHAANDASRDRWEMQETDMIGFLPNRGLTGEMSPPLPACRMHPLGSHLILLTPFKDKQSEQAIFCFSVMVENLLENLLSLPNQQSDTLPDGLKLFW